MIEDLDIDIEKAISNLLSDKSKIKKKLASLCYSIFECTDAGKELLSLLERCYLIETPTCSPNDNPYRAFYREGENNMIRSIKAFINFHKQTIGAKNV